MRRFVLRTVVATTLLVGPCAFAQGLSPSTAPTIQDVDPGIDHTGRDVDLPPELRRQ